MSPDPGALRHRHGTHRACPPEETWARLRPLLPRMGITRVADITHLDSLGIPVFEAHRPGSRNQTVSQGKGVTPLLSRVSAVMEMVEWVHAEEPPAGERASVAEMRPHLGYDPFRLDLTSPSLLGEQTVIDWLPARRLADGAPSWVPRELVVIDSTVLDRGMPPLFTAIGNGLGSGNTAPEAALHGVCELIERHLTAFALDEAAERRSLDPRDSGDEVVEWLLERCDAAGNHLQAFDLGSHAGIACVEVDLWSETVPVWQAGFGCHPDPGIAFSRALSEAAQTRAAYISGARDDLEDDFWVSRREHASPAPEPPEPVIALRDLPDLSHSSLEVELERARALAVELGADEPLAVDLRRDDIGVDVLMVVAPGFRSVNL